MTCDHWECDKPSTVTVTVTFHSDNTELVLELCSAHATDRLAMVDAWNEGIVM
jgi:hypothetical protein